MRIGRGTRSTGSKYRGDMEDQTVTPRHTQPTEPEPIDDGDRWHYQALIDAGRTNEAINLMAGLHGWCGTGWTSSDIERIENITAEYERCGLIAAMRLADRLLNELYEAD